MTDEEKFRSFALTAYTPERCAELCRKYLEKVKDPIVTETKTLWAGGQFITTLNAQCELDMDTLTDLGQIAAAENVDRRLYDLILGEIRKGKYVKIDSARDLAHHTMKYRAKLNVWTGDKR